MSQSFNTFAAYYPLPWPRFEVPSILPFARSLVNSRFWSICEKLLRKVNQNLMLTLLLQILLTNSLKLVMLRCQISTVHYNRKFDSANGTLVIVKRMCSFRSQRGFLRRSYIWRCLSLKLPHHVCDGLFFNFNIYNENTVYMVTVKEMNSIGPLNSERFVHIALRMTLP